MSRYQPLPGGDTTSSPSTPRRPSFSPSIASSFRRPTRQPSLPDPSEMDAAFDGPDEEEDDDVRGNHETSGLLGGRDQNTPVRREGRIPGDYDFERDYTQPPESPPPFQPYSSHNPAPGNTNGEIPTAPIYRPNHNRHFLGGILPTALLPRQQGGPRLVGGGNSGIFGNLAARPDAAIVEESRREGPEWVPEDEQKDGPPSYQAALRDAVPPYWETTVVLPSSSSPFGPLSSSMSGDEILIDGMPTGNFFGFFWNLIVSASFQFVGFLLTYVLHTTHAAKYGSRVGLGITMIQFGLTLRSRAEDLINSGKFPTDPSDPLPTDAATAEELAAQNEISAYWGNASPWPATIHDPLGPPDGPPTVLHDLHEAEIYAHNHNQTLTDLLGLPSAGDVGRANEWFSFMIMSVGWFLVLTSLGGYWRVKRFEKKLRNAQRESENAQAEAAANRDGGVSTGTAQPVESGIGETENRDDGIERGPMTIEYYTDAFRGWFAGARDIQRGFFGMRGRPVGEEYRSTRMTRGGRGTGHTPLSQEGDENELLDAQGFGLEPMASSNIPENDRRGRGLWGV